MHDHFIYLLIYFKSLPWAAWDSYYYNEDLVVLVKFFAKESYNFLSRLLLIHNKKSRLELTSSIKKTALIIPSTYDSCEPEKFSPLCDKTEKKRNINSKHSIIF